MMMRKNQYEMRKVFPPSKHKDWGIQSYVGGARPLATDTRQSPFLGADPRIGMVCDLITAKASSILYPASPACEALYAVDKRVREELGIHELELWTGSLQGLGLRFLGGGLFGIYMERFAYI